MSLRLALFASGGGTNALNLLEVAKDLPELEIALVIVDQATSPLLKILSEKFPKLTVKLISMPTGNDVKTRKQAHEKLILDELKEHRIDWIFLAGYMRMVGPTLLAEYSSQGKSHIVNIHPSLLPAYPGLHAYERAFAANDQKSGVTIHLVDSGMDTGTILVQESFERLPNDTLQNFMDRGKALEWRLYGDILKTLARTKTLEPKSLRTS